MKVISRLFIAALLGAGTLALSTLGASAAIVCRGHTCWHVHESYNYPRTAHVVVHEDNWHWGPREHYTIHEHEGRGYWRGGTWVEW